MTVLIAAVKASMRLLETPSPVIARTALEGDGVVYEISYSVALSSGLTDAKTELLGLIQRHLHHAGIALSVAGRAETPQLATPTPAILLAQSDLFGALSTDDRELLSEFLVSVPFPAGAKIIEQFETTEALFIIASGTVEIVQSSASVKHVLRRMSPGGSLGAVGLITGAPSAVTGLALTPVKTYRLDKKSIAAALARRPELAAGLEALAARGNNNVSEDQPGEDEKLVETRDLRSKIRGFLDRLSVLPL